MILSLTAGLFWVYKSHTICGCEMGYCWTHKLLAMKVGSMGFKLMPSVWGRVSGSRMKRVMDLDVNLWGRQVSHIRGIHSSVFITKFVEVDDIVEMVMIICSSCGV